MGQVCRYAPLEPERTKSERFRRKTPKTSQNEPRPEKTFLWRPRIAKVKLGVGVRFSVPTLVSTNPPRARRRPSSAPESGGPDDLMAWKRMDRLEQPTLQNKKQTPGFLLGFVLALIVN
jgi:hypothetical protein